MKEPLKIEPPSIPESTEPKIIKKLPTKNLAYYINAKVQRRAANKAARKARRTQRLRMK